MIYLGVDPGKDGAIVALDEKTRTVGPKLRAQPLHFSEWRRQMGEGEAGSLVES